MEELKFGLIKGVIAMPVKLDPAFIKAISERTQIPIEWVTVMMRSNVFTINQFIDLSELADSTIRNKLRPTIINGELNTELDYCYPYQSSKNEGPLFILRNEKSEKILKV